MVDTGLSSGPAPVCTGIAPEVASLDIYPRYSGCIKHFKTTRAVSWIIRVHTDSLRTFMVPPGLYWLDTFIPGSLNKDLPGPSTVTVFYSPVNLLVSCQAWSVYLTTHFPRQT